MLFLLLAASDPDTGPIEAERAFARAAQAKGQWTAFREFMTDDAIVFGPQPEKARESLPTRNPPIAVQWWPAESYVSCDGTVAVNTGPWVRPKSNGYFTTVWVKQGDGGWKWVIDQGDALAKPRALPEKPKVRHAACSKPFTVYLEPCLEGALKCGSGKSEDGSLVWSWTVTTDGARTFKAMLWNGKGFDDVVRDEVTAPK